MTVRQLRLRLLNNMAIEELESLNEKLIGKGQSWATQERIDVCEILGKKLSEYFTCSN